MAQANFVEVTGNASISSIARGVSSSYAPPSGGGSRVFAFSSQDNGTGAVALYLAMAGANPTAKGASISGALQRGPSAGAAFSSIFLFAQLTNPSIQGVAYTFGLSDAAPSHFVLRKGDLASGLPDAPPGQQGVLARSTSAIADQTWYHLRLDAILNRRGEVVLTCLLSDIGSHPVGSPVWTPISGMAAVVDDALGVLSGTPPLAAGRMGFGFRSSDVARVGLVDAVKPGRQ